MLRASVLLIAAAAGAMIGCKSGTGSDCEIVVNSAAQTGNIFTATGTFKGGQPILRLSRGGTGVGAIAATTYGNGTATFNITGLAKGAYTTMWDMSCDNGDTISGATAAVPTITIQ